MNLALIRKELREHWVVLGLVFALDTLTLIGMLIRESDKGGRFSALVSFVEVPGALSAIVAANRFIAREYAGRTQLFLEVLPVGRARVWATKWLLGGAYLGVLTGGAWFATLSRARRVEVIATHDALHVLVTLGSFMLVTWSFAAMAAMLGRHRYTAWIAVVSLASLVVNTAKLNFSELPVLRLLGEHVAMARAPLDWSALVEAWLVAALFAAGSAILALAGSGAIASALAQKMTARERVFLFVTIVVGLFAFSVVDKGRNKPAYALAGAIYAKSTRVRVGVLPSGDMVPSAAAALADTIAGDVAGLVQSLWLVKAPPVFIVPQRGLDPTVVQRAKLEENEGIVLGAAPEVEVSLLRAQVLHGLLADYTRQRAMREDRHVLLDGFTTWWALRANPEERELYWLRAAASGGPVTAPALTRWSETAEQLGPCIADGFAFAAVDVLARRIGRTALLSLARSLFSRPPNDFRVLFERKPEELLQQAGITWSALASQTESERQAVLQRRASELSQGSKRSAAIEVKHSARQGARIDVSLTGAEAYWALYTELGPWATSQSTMSRLDVHAPRATLPLSAARGARVLVEVEANDASLRCPVRVLSRRLTLP